ncbi:MAG: restriction endonuclease [Ardenticatenaceae bacterium]|nr:restriction endonuclease [Ardenticatenaceae bacterium]
MIARFDWQIGSRSSAARLGAQTRLSARLAALLLGGLTAVFLLWLLLHYALLAVWFAAWPGLLADTLRLLEASGIVTLTLLWLIWGWRLVQGRPSAARLAARPHTPTVEELYALSPAEFEKYVAQLFRRKGYKVKLRGRSGDRGVDLELLRTGGKRAIVQCKRYQHTIGPDIVRELYGTLIHEKVAHAFLVTTADISDAAREWAMGKPMTLVDGTLLVDVAASLSQNGS